MNDEAGAESDDDEADDDSDDEGYKRFVKFIEGKGHRKTPAGYDEFINGLNSNHDSTPFVDDEDEESLDEEDEDGPHDGAAFRKFVRTINGGDDGSRLAEADHEELDDEDDMPSGDRGDAFERANDELFSDE